MNVKSRLVRWLKNTALCTEHLDSAIDTVQNWMTNIIYQQKQDSYGVIEMEIDQIQITRGILEIKNISCIFPDISFVNYNRESFLQAFSDGTESNNIYPLNLNLQDYFQDSKIEQLTVYLAKEDSCTDESKEVINELGGKVVIYYKTPKLKLITTVKDNNITIPICKISVKNGAFIMNSYIPPCLTLNNQEIEKKIENTLLLINNKTLALRDKILSSTIEDYKSHMSMQSLLQTIEKLDYIIGHKLHPREIYSQLRKCIYDVLWLNYHSTPSIQVYDHNNIFQIFNNMLNILISLVDAGKGINRFNLVEKDKGEFYGELAMEFSDYITFLISPINENLVNKIKICSQSYVDDVKKRRIIGANRKIIKMVGNVMVLQVERKNFINNNENIVVLGAENCSQISILTE